MTKKPLLLACSVLVFIGGFVAGNVVRAQSDGKRVFELRTYTAPEGKLGELDKRSATTRCASSRSTGWKTSATGTRRTRPIRRTRSSTSFRTKAATRRRRAGPRSRRIPEWQKVSTESQVNGRIVSKVVSVFMDPTITRR